MSHLKQDLLLPVKSCCQRQCFEGENFGILRNASCHHASKCPWLKRGAGSYQQQVILHWLQWFTNDTTCLQSCSDCCSLVQIQCNIDALPRENSLQQLLDLRNSSGASHQNNFMNLQACSVQTSSHFFHVGTSKSMRSHGSIKKTLMGLLSALTYVFGGCSLCLTCGHQLSHDVYSSYETISLWLCSNTDTTLCLSTSRWYAVNLD